MSRSASQHAKELHSVVTRRPIQETGRAVMDDHEDSKPEEYSDMTGGSTGDSGFGEPLLKITLPGEYIVQLIGRAQPGSIQQHQFMNCKALYGDCEESPL